MAKATVLPIAEVERLSAACDRRLLKVVGLRDLLEEFPEHPRSAEMEKRVATLNRRLARDLQRLAAWADTPAAERPESILAASRKRDAQRRGEEGSKRRKGLSKREEKRLAREAKKAQEAMQVATAAQAFMGRSPHFAVAPAYTSNPLMAMNGHMPLDPRVLAKSQHLIQMFGPGARAAQARQHAVHQAQVHAHAQAHAQAHVQAQAAVAAAAAAARPSPLRPRGPVPMGQMRTPGHILMLLEDVAAQRAFTTEAIAKCIKEGCWECQIRLRDGRQASWGPFATEKDAEDAHLRAAYESGCLTFDDDTAERLYPNHPWPNLPPRKDPAPPKTAGTAGQEEPKKLFASQEQLWCDVCEVHYMRKNHQRHHKSKRHLSMVQLKKANGGKSIAAPPNAEGKDASSPTSTSPSPSTTPAPSTDASGRVPQAEGPAEPPTAPGPPAPDSSGPNGTTGPVLHSAPGMLPRGMPHAGMPLPMGHPRGMMPLMMPPGSMALQNTSNQSMPLQTRPSQAMGSQATGFQAMGSQTMGSQAMGSQTMGSQAMGTQAMGSQAMGSQAMGSRAMGSQAIGSQTMSSQSMGSQGMPFHGGFPNGMGHARPMSMSQNPPMPGAQKTGQAFSNGGPPGSQGKASASNPGANHANFQQLGRKGDGFVGGPMPGMHMPFPNGISKGRFPGPIPTSNPMATSNGPFHPHMTLPMNGQQPPRGGSQTHGMQMPHPHPHPLMGPGQGASPPLRQSTRNRSTRVQNRVGK